MQKTDNRLVSCKLCGGNARICKIEQSDGYCHYDDWIVRCNKCGCTFKYPADDYYGRDYLHEEQVIEKWNALHGGGS